MRRLIVLTLALPLLLGCFAIWPVASAFQIKQAIKAGDVATLERMVQWATVRASLKASLAELSPTMQITGDETRLMRGQQMPSIWSRVKAAATPMLADRFIDSYITADGVTQLQQVRNGTYASLFGIAPSKPQLPPKKHRWFSKSNSAAPDPEQRPGSAPETADDCNIASRFLSFYSRIVRARFYSLSLAEFEIADRHNPDRRVISQFALSNFEWKLSSVRIVGVGF